MADNTISPVVPNVSGGRNVSTGQKAVTQTAAQSGIDFKIFLCNNENIIEQLDCDGKI